MDLEAVVPRQPKKVVCDYCSVSFRKPESTVRKQSLYAVYYELSITEGGDLFNILTSEIELLSWKFFLLNVSDDKRHTHGL